MCKSYESDNFLNEYTEYLKGSKNHNPYIDPDGRTSVSVVPFYAELTEFLNIRESKFFKNSKDKYVYLPPKKSLKFLNHKYDKYIDTLDDYKITVLKNGNRCFRLTSDQFGFSAPHISKSSPYCKLKDKHLVSEYLYHTRTIGGSFLFPTLDKERRCSYNSARNSNSYIEDRVDLTLLEIKHAYEPDYKDNYKSDILHKQYDNEESHMREWLEHFGSFPKFAEFFCFKDNFVKNGQIVDIITSDIENGNIKYIEKNAETYKKNKNTLVNQNEDDLMRILKNVRELTIKRSEQIEKIIKSKESK